MSTEESDGGGGGAAPSSSSTGDVTALFTPPPGSPAVLRRAATTLNTKADSLPGLVGPVAQIHQNLVAPGSFEGQGATAYRSFANDTVELYGAARTPMTGVATSVSTYADALDTLQKALSGAKGRYDTAVAAGQKIVSDYNALTAPTQADADAAQTKLNTQDANAQSAVDDATTAWTTYNSSCETAAGQASDAASESEAEQKGPFPEWLEKYVTGPNDKFHSVWDLIAADPALEAVTKTAEKSGKSLAQIAKAIADDKVLWSSKVSAIEALDDIGKATPQNLLDAAMYGRRLDALEAFGGDAAPAAARVGALASGLKWLGRGIGVTALLGDATTIIDPQDKGAMGWVDRGAAGVNGTLVAVNLVTDEIPVAGEVVMVGTAAYLAGDYLYHHWEPFRNVCNDVGGATVTAVKAVGNAASDVAGGVSHAASGAWHAVSSWF